MKAVSRGNDGAVRLPDHFLPKKYIEPYVHHDKQVYEQHLGAIHYTSKLELKKQPLLFVIFCYVALSDASIIQFEKTY